MNKYGYIGITSEVFSCLRTTTASGPQGVVICNPLGHEHTHSFSTHYCLAEQLAELNVASIRFDYPGTGNSSSESTTPLAINRFVDAANQAANTLLSEVGVSQVVFFGIRFGALIAGLAASKVPGSSLIMWNSCPHGKVLVRDLTIMKDAGPTEADGALNSGGFLYSRKFLDELNELDPRKFDYSGLERVLYIDRKTSPSGKRLIDHIRSTGVPLEHSEIEGYSKMMRRPQASIPAQKVLSAIGEWIQTVPTPTTKPDNTDVAPNTDAENANSLATLQKPAGECQVLQIPVRNGQSIFGVMTRATTEQKDRPVVLIPNTGAAHNVGPGYLHVHLCNKLKDIGISTLRIDISNLGESIGSKPSSSNDPYPQSLVTNIIDAANYLKSTMGYSKVAAAGICSGAYGSFCAASAVQEPLFSNLILINAEGYLKPPYIVKNETGTQTSLLSTITIFCEKAYRVVLRKALGVQNRLARTLITAGVLRATKMTRTLGALYEKKTQVDFVFSDENNGERLLRNLCAVDLEKLSLDKQMTIHRFLEADHTFSHHAHRAQLLNAIVEVLSIPQESK